MGAAGKADNHVTCGLEGEADLEEEEVRLNCSPASILRLTNRIENSYCIDSRLLKLASDMADCVGTSRGYVEEEVDSQGGSSDSGLAQTLDADQIEHTTKNLEGQVDTLLGKDYYFSSRAMEANVGNRRMYCMPNSLAAWGRDLNLETFPDMIHWGSLGLDWDRTWRRNSVANVEGRMQANQIESCKTNNLNTRYLKEDSFHREEVLVDFRRNGARKASKVERLVVGKMEEDCLFVDDEAAQAEHLCSQTCKKNH